MFLYLLLFLFGVEVRKSIHLGPVVQPRDDKFFIFVVFVFGVEVKKAYTWVPWSSHGMTRVGVEKHNGYRPAPV